METNYIKLANEINSYTYFEKDQVLTSKQLNEIVQYLDVQNRLTRTKLFGAGIVCGLELSLTKDFITLSKGVSVTTDGDLLHFNEDVEFKFITSFDDKNAKYPPFISNNKQIEIFELLTDNKKAPDAKLISQFGGEDEFSKMAAVLYNESFLFDPDICTGNNCDNMGQIQNNNLKVLLIRKNLLIDLISKMPDAQNPYHKIPDLFIERVLFPDGKINNQDQLVEAYHKVIKNTVKNLNDQFPKIYSNCAEILDYKNDPTKAWGSRLKSIAESISSNDLGFQYVYDFLCDLIQTYSEFKEELFDAMSFCSLDYKLFPKHVLLGSVVKEDEFAKDPFRHGFYRSPLLNSDDTKIQRVKYLFKRLELMIERFSVPKRTETLKVTPSQSLNSKVGIKAIPYYYKFEGREGTINNFWNYDHSLRLKSNMIQSFNAAQYSDHPSVTRPLNFDLSAHEFFRVEGHMGKEVGQAEEDLNSIIKKYNLPIKVTTVQIEEDTRHLRPRPGYNLSWLKNYHYLLRRDMIDHLQNLKLFNNNLNNTIQESPDSNNLPQGALKDPSINITKYTKDSSKKLNDDIEANVNNLKKGYSKFDHHTLKTKYPILLENAASVNKNTKNVLYSSAFTPIENIISNSKFKWFDWIGTILKEKEEDDKKKQTFKGFLSEHPGIDHTGGVSKGGTFVLVYSSKDKKVTADFSLPYYCCEAEVDDKEIEREIDVDNDISVLIKDKTKWNNLNDFQVYISKDFEFTEKFKNLDEKLFDFSGKIEMFDHKIASQKDSLNVYSGNLDILNGNIRQIIGGGGFKPGDFMGDIKLGDSHLKDSAGMLSRMNDILDMLNEKEKGGRSTPNDAEVRKGIEKTASDILISSFEKINDRTSDITDDSAEAEFISKTKEMFDKFKDSASKEKVRNNLTSLKNNSGNKNTFIKYIDKF